MRVPTNLVTLRIFKHLFFVIKVSTFSEFVRKHKSVVVLTF
ncbi:hypothetical protein LEP1GSC204_0270 [Leptospira interrogans serovar Copenhageni str. M20]|uniref:Uncharacterized protein n=1 Tax=Leptospira interrogans serovar Copenhageni str. LT2050 TaxID=1001598 RepID=M3HYI0_LEPIT|nr:hypothetical protein LEP1GSC150_4236 [Leptospira interrogans serovar Copenhageni str. LT2050]EMO18423.1 hypothetical protein LEP1GSC167_1605 [Leptospira interrogans serovar Copenhageni str. HAI0188]EMY52969.1 hypothetical protein LEP1GSC204_0270 [Leptospira interrogans serovar Copenhageni str. M20]